MPRGHLQSVLQILILMDALTSITLILFRLSYLLLLLLIFYIPRDCNEAFVNRKPVTSVSDARSVSPANGLFHNWFGAT